MARKGSIQSGKGLEHVFYKGLKYRIQSCGKYYYRNQPEHLLHRTVWIDHYGLIPEGYVIHHKDHNWRNNDISNLEMVNRKEHGKIHNKDSIASRIYKMIKCPVCEKEFKTWYAKFCSSTCYNKVNKKRYYKEIECVICGKKFNSSRHLKKGQDKVKTCSYACRGKMMSMLSKLSKKLG
ncbi:MAG: hypothetical protein C5B43_00615 [Verrucomicrobia bacterium]|nr:MAG: hypothetical protein C5B43_00615 [Verrucomicrobiota bacterium]